MTLSKILLTFVFITLGLALKVNQDYVLIHTETTELLNH